MVNGHPSSWFYLSLASFWIQQSSVLYLTPIFVLIWVLFWTIRILLANIKCNQIHRSTSEKDGSAPLYLLSHICLQGWYVLPQFLESTWFFHCNQPFWHGYNSHLRSDPILLFRVQHFVINSVVLCRVIIVPPRNPSYEGLGGFLKWIFGQPLLLHLFLRSGRTSPLELQCGFFQLDNSVWVLLCLSLLSFKCHYFNEVLHCRLISETLPTNIIYI